MFNLAHARALALTGLLALPLAAAASSQLVTSAQHLLYGGQYPAHVDVTRYGDGEPQPPNTVSNGLVAEFDDFNGRSAHASATLDARTGTLRTVTTARNATGTGIVAAMTHAGIGDEWTVLSNQPTARLAFTLSFHSVFQDGLYGFGGTQGGQMLVASSVNVSLLAEMPTPPDWGTEAGPTYMAPVVQQWAYWSNSFDSLYREPTYPYEVGPRAMHADVLQGTVANAWDESEGYQNQWMRTLSFTVDVPTNARLEFGIAFDISSFCTRTTACSATNDSGSTFQMSVQALDGDLRSANGYFGAQRIAEVPEPETYALMLAGLAALGWRARRAKASRTA